MLLIILLNIVNIGLVSLNNNCNWPNHCDLINYDWDMFGFKCELDSLSQLTFNFNLTWDQIDQCNLNNKNVPIVFRSRAILNKNSINFSNLDKIINKYKTTNFSIIFKYFDGFQVDLLNESDLFPNKSHNDVFINYDMANMEFYFKDKLLETCEDFFNQNLTIFKSIFHLGSFLNPFNTKSNIMIKNCKFKHKICPLVFINSKMDSLIIYGLFETFIKTNILRFDDLNSYTLKNSNGISLNSSIEELVISNYYIEKLNSEFLNIDVFKNLKSIIIGQYLKFLQTNLFKSFSSLRNIRFELEKLPEFLHRNGIEWINYLNINTNVNLSDHISYKNELRLNDFDEIKIELYMACVFEIEQLAYRYPDEDFCLYKDFPFNQLVYIYDIGFWDLKFRNMNNIPTCTFLWLAQFYPLYHVNTKHTSENRYLTKRVYYNYFVNLSKVCDFKTKLEACKKARFTLGSSDSSYDENIRVTSDFIHLILIFLSPFICLFGLFTNLLVILTVLHIKKQKDLKDFRHYDYMRINSIVHCILLIIQIFGMINECTQEFWCSQIQHLMFIQYYKIVFSQFLDTSLRFLSNFTYLAFSLCRLSLIGKEHGKLVMYVSQEKSIKLYMIITVFLSLTLGVVKYFEYFPNEMEIASIRVDFSFPEKFVFLGRLQDIDKTRAFLIVNSLCDLINYLIFSAIHLFMDIKIFKELKKTINEKAERTEQSEKQKRKNEQTIKRAMTMVILNLTSNLLLKFPLLLNAFIEFYVEEIQRETVDQNDNYIYSKNFIFYYCYYYKSCDWFDLFSNLLFYVSISLSFLFFFKFDKNFESSFRRSVLKEDEYIKVEKKIVSNKKITTNVINF